MTNKTMLLTDSSFLQALDALPAFLLVNDVDLDALPAFLLVNDVDLDMAYDWVCDQSRPFAHDEKAFDLFYDVYQEAQDSCYFS